MEQERNQDRSPGRRERLARSLARHVVNPIMRALLQAGLAPRTFALLETTGRRSGRPRLTPLGNGLEDHVFWIVAEHGTRSSYVQNLLANPRVRVKVGRVWRTGSATLVPEDNGRWRRQQMGRAHGLLGRIDALAFRAAATTPCTIRVDLEVT